ncbi:MAG: hypothetical protein UH541_05685, partial [Prevotella sp.]|nr:hypothetical protein [Prevotella sp.]
QYNKIPLVKKDYDSTKIYRKTHKKGASQTYDTPSLFFLVERASVITIGTFIGSDKCLSVIIKY